MMRGRVIDGVLIFVVQRVVFGVQAGQLDGPSLPLRFLILGCRLFNERAIGSEDLIQPVLVDPVGPASELVEEAGGVLFIELGHPIYLLCPNSTASKEKIINSSSNDKTLDLKTIFYYS